MTQRVKNLPAVQENPAMCKTQVQSLSREDLLEEEMATHSSILAWRIHGRYGPCGSPRVGHDAIASWEIDGETVETVSDFIFGAPKSLQMVTAAMKLKDTYSLEKKL